MELFLILVIVGVSIFIGTSLAAILFLLQENKELNQDINDSQPPFQGVLACMDQKSSGLYQNVIKHFTQFLIFFPEMSVAYAKIILC